MEPALTYWSFTERYWFCLLCLSSKVTACVSSCTAWNPPDPFLIFPLSFVVEEFTVPGTKVAPFLN
jgi:hypothetical protein